MLLSFLISLVFKVLVFSLTPAEFAKEFTSKAEGAELLKIDLLIIQNLSIDEIDLQEKFKDLEEYVFSKHLFELSEETTKLVPSPKSIVREEFFTPNLKILSLTSENEEKQKEYQQKKVLPYLYERIPFQQEMLDMKDNLERSRDFRVLYYNSWYQPSERKDTTIPVYLEAEKKGKKVYGELKVYKERFLHLNSNIRLAEKTEVLVNEKVKPNLSNFQTLLNLSTSEEDKIIDENSYWVDTIFNTVRVNLGNFSNFIIPNRFIEPVIVEVKDEYEYKDLYEIKKETKLNQDFFNFIDHPYFSILIRVQEY